MEKRIEPRMLEPWRLAEIEQLALARDDEDARVLRELLSHAAYHEEIGIGSYFTSFADAAARAERDSDADEAEEPDAQPPAAGQEEWVAESDGVMWGVTPRSAPMLFRLCESEEEARELAARWNAEEARS